jgi:hypothetical protein
MSAIGALIRAFGVDGPCQGVIYLDLDSGHVLFHDFADGERCVYRISDETVDSIAGRYRAAYFDHFESAWRPDSTLTGTALTAARPQRARTTTSTSPPATHHDSAINPRVARLARVSRVKYRQGRERVARMTPEGRRVLRTKLMLSSWQRPLVRARCVPVTPRANGLLRALTDTRRPRKR